MHKIKISISPASIIAFGFVIFFGETGQLHLQLDKNFKGSTMQWNNISSCESQYSKANTVMSSTPGNGDLNVFFKCSCVTSIPSHLITVFLYNLKSGTVLRMYRKMLEECILIYFTTSWWHDFIGFTVGAVGLFLCKKNDKTRSYYK